MIATCVSGAMPWMSLRAPTFFASWDSSKKKPERR